jgi:hypothetical protein
MTGTTANTDDTFPDPAYDSHRMRVSRRELRRWVANHRAAERREHAEQTNVARDPAHALAAALRLIAIARARHGWPLPTDQHAAAEDERAWAAWARLRRTARA